MTTGSKLQRVHRLMDQAVERGHFPSACLLVAHRGQSVLHRAYGRGDLDTVYDLASLTKVLATTTVAMQLTADGSLDLKAPVSRWLPEVDRPETRRMQIKHLLGHCSGLPAWLPLYEHPRVVAASATRRKGIIRRLVAGTELAAPVGRETIYSDLGFIVLEWTLERCGGAPLDRLAGDLFGTLGLDRTRFIRHGRRGLVERLRERWSFAPTERCPWRRRRLVAEVHDDNCHAMGGVAGHAGLFGTAHDLHRIADELVAAYHGRRSVFDRQTVRRFFHHRPRRTATRVLGWDTPDPVSSSAGSLFNRRSVGHLGFTGTSLWIDLPRRLWVVLLTNRVHDGREPNPMPTFRPRVHDAIMRAIDA